MTAPVSGTLGGAVAQVANAGGQLGKEEFLELLVTQLRYQDPLSPMQADQLAVQLAQFSSVEQLIQINDKLGAQGSDSAMLNLTMNTNIAASTIGKKVLSVGNELLVKADAPAEITADVAAPGGSAEVGVFNSAGVEVATVELGSVGGGRKEFSFDPGNSVTPGIYTYELRVNDPAGNPVAVQPYTSGIIDGVQFADGQVVLRSGDLLIPMSNLVEINQVTD